MIRLKIAIIIVVASLCLGVFSLCFIQHSCGRLSDMLDKIITDIHNKDKESTIKDLQTTIDYYEKIKPVINILEGQGETIEIRGDLNKAIFFFNTKDYQSAVLYLEECKTDLNRIIVSNIPSISTIF
jgi:hypothetical protein